MTTIMGKIKYVWAIKSSLKYLPFIFSSITRPSSIVNILYIMESGENENGGCFLKNKGKTKKEYC